jgi:hypothetical protein
MRDLPAPVVSPVRGCRSWCATAGPGGAAGVGRGGAEPLRDGGGSVVVVLGWGAAVSGMTWFRFAGGEGVAASAAGRNAGRPGRRREGKRALTDAHQGGR